MSFSAGYNYFYEKYDSLFCIAIYDGWGNLITSDQFGSKHTDIGYKTDAHSFILSGNIEPIDNLNFKVNASYTTGKGNIKDFKFDHLYNDPYFNQDLKIMYNVSSLNPNMPYLYDTYYLNGVSDYSDINFSETELSLGVIYTISKNVGIGINYFYDNYQDNESDYVYGNQGATVQSLIGFLTYNF